LVSTENDGRYLVGKFLKDNKEYSLIIQMDTIHTFTVSSEIQTSCESSVDACSKEARWNSL
jgi:hypothetical protein